MNRSFKTTEVCASTGVTFRQLTYWVRRGLVTPSIDIAKGSGQQHRWSAEDVTVIQALSGITSTTVTDLDRLRAVTPLIREVLSDAGGDAMLVVYASGAAVASSADDLVALIREHRAVHVVAVPTLNLETSDAGAVA